MTDQEKDPAPPAESEGTAAQAKTEAPEAAATAPEGTTDVAISETENGAGSTAIAPIAIGRPPVGKVLVGIATVLALWFLAGVAGGVKQQACLAQVTAKYGAGTSGGKAGVADLARKNNAAKCSSSPF
jgi:hypothetical protein